MDKPIAVAFSGGLDTSYLVASYAEQGHPVTAISVNTGAWDDAGLTALAAHARKLGASEHVAIDGRRMLYDDAIAWLIRGNVLRGHVYPLCVGAERVVQAHLFAQEANARGITTLAHGSTGAGNDQVRFDVTLRAVAPHSEVQAPIRDRELSREFTSGWLAARQLGPLQKDAAVSINQGLWGTTAGGRETHDAWLSPTEASFPTTTSPAEGPAEGVEIVIAFDKGLPVAVDGVACEGWEAIRRLAEIGAAHGIGRGVHLGDTILGIKGRVAFEAPAASILIAAHRELEKLVLTKRQRDLKDRAGAYYGDLLHEGLWLDPVCRDLERLIESSQERVTGEARVRLRRLGCDVQGVRSPHALMVAGARYGEGSALWDGRDAEGFAKIYGIAARLAEETR